MMHAGYPYLQEMKAIMYLYPQVNADLGVIDWILPREDFVPPSVHAGRVRKAPDVRV